MVPMVTSPVAGHFGPFSYNVATHTWWWSDALFRIHGFEPGDVVPTTELLVAHKHPDDAAVSMAVIQGALMGGQPFSLWHRIVDASRRVRQVVSIGDGVRDAGGRLVEISGYMVDITDSLRAETKREVDEAVQRSAESRAAIEQAKGALMAACALSETEAFEVLRQRSQHTNVKLRDLARQLVTGLEESRAVPADPHLRIARILGATVTPSVNPAARPSVDPTAGPIG